MISKDEIIRMAREAASVYATETWTFSLSTNQLERFASLVAAHTQEQCAKVCDVAEKECAELKENIDHALFKAGLIGAEKKAKKLAEDIRAMK